MTDVFSLLDTVLAEVPETLNRNNQQINLAYLQALARAQTMRA